MAKTIYNDKGVAAKPAALAVKAIHHIREIQYAMQKEQDALLAKNGKALQLEKLEDFTMDNFAKEVRAKNDELIESTNKFNAEVKDCIVPYGVKSNKMVEILKGVNSLSDEVIINLAAGKKVKDFDNAIEIGKLPNLGNNEFWGSSASTFYSAALVTVNTTMTGLSFSNIINPKHSSISYSFEIPLTTFTKNEDFTYDTKYEKTSFIVIHSGYSFGGSYSSINQFAPNDCGTFVGKQYMAQKLFPKATTSTADLICAWRHHQEGAEYISEEWYKSESFNIVQLFDINRSEDTIGSTYLLRRFDKANPEQTSLGAGGHTAIIIGTNEKNEFVTIGANRDMPKMEGYGLQYFAKEEKKGTPEEAYKQTYVLVPTEIVLEQPEFIEFSDIPYNGLSDLQSVVEHFDTKLVGANEDITTPFL